MNEPHSAESDALWIEAPREVKDRINEAVRALEAALDDLTREATWAHLSSQAEVIQVAAARLVMTVVEVRPTRPLPPGEGHA